MENRMPSFYICLPVFFPVIMGIMMLCFPLKQDKPRNIINFIFIVFNSLLAMIVMDGLEGESVDLISFYKDYGLTLRIDRSGRIFGSIVSVLWPFASIYAYEYMMEEKSRNKFFAFYTMTFGVVLGIAFSADLLSMYVFYEMLTLVTFPLVMHTKTKEAIRAGVTYLAYSLGGAAFGLIGVIFAMKYGNGLEFTWGGIIRYATEGERGMILAAFVLAFCGFSVKAAMAPFSRWLIKAAVAPTPVTALLHAVAVVNAGAFACIRLIYFVFGTDLLKGTWAQYTVMFLAMATILYGSSFAIKETHFKRRLAYSTISNLSYILFAATIMSDLGIIAAFTHMIMHSVTKICSFYCAGIVMEKAKKNYVYELDGIGRRMKLTFACFTISSLSLVGIPMFACFHGKWNIGVAAVSDGNVMSIAGLCVLLLSALFTLIYMFSIIIRAFFPEIRIAKAAGHETGRTSGRDKNKAAGKRNSKASDSEVGEAEIQNLKTGNADFGPESVSSAEEEIIGFKKAPMMHLTIICAAVAIIILGVYWSPLFEMIQAVTKL